MPGRELEAAERLRKERIKQRAAQNLNKSKLPKRMEMWEKKQKEAKARKAKEDKRKHRRGSRGNVPKVNTKVPDFDKLKSSWNKTMANARAKFKPTKPQSFSFDSQERKAVSGAHPRHRDHCSPDTCPDCPRSHTRAARTGGREEEA